MTARDNRNLAEQYFIEHGLMPPPELRDTKWVLHHNDTQLKYTDPDRYDEWNVYDLTPMTQADHNTIHHSGDMCNFYGIDHSGENNPMYGVHKPSPFKGKPRPECSHKSYIGEDSPVWGRYHTDEERRKMSESHMGKQAPNRIPVICVETGDVFDCIKEAKAWLGKGDIIYALKTGKTAGGYHWKKVD